MAIVTPRPRLRLTRKDLRDLRRRQAQKARATRRELDRNHDLLPEPVRALFDPLQPAFRRTVYHRWVLLALAAILTVGGRTLSNLLRCLGGLAPGHSSSYHHIFSRRRWSARALTRPYIAAVLARFAPRGPVALVGDDTVTEHPGPQVYGKGCHRDPVRSTRSFTAFRWGHKGSSWPCWSASRSRAGPGPCR
jgi:hypothetical protein